MKYIKQILVILIFTLLGELLAYWIPLPIPAAIYGLVLLLAGLCTGIVKTQHIHTAAQFLLSILPFLLVAPAVNILKHWGLIADNWISICIIVVVSSVVVFAVTGLVTQYLVQRKGGEDNG